MTNWTQEAMEKRLVRYADLKGLRNAFIDARTPGSDRKENFTIIGPGVSENPAQVVHIPEAHGFNFGAARQPFGCTNSQHSHLTAETFLVHTGKWRLVFGADKDEGYFDVEPGDVATVPTLMFRGFEKRDEGTGFLAVVLGHDDPGKVVWAPSVFKMAEDFGLKLLKGGKLIDTTLGEKVPDGAEMEQPPNAAKLKELATPPMSELQKYALKADDMKGNPNSPLAGPGVEEDALIGDVASKDGFAAGPIVGHWQHDFALRRLKLETGASIPTHSRGEQEVIFVQSGTLEFSWAGGKLVMGAGDTLTVPVGLMHAYRNPSSADAIAFVIRGAAAPASSCFRRKPRGGRVMGGIRTTHVGSLPRSKQITDLVFAREAGVPIDEAGFNAIVGAAVTDIVAQQKAAGVDLPSDGEMSKISYATYIKDRLTGFAGDSSRRPPMDLEQVPGFLERQAKGGGTPTYKRPKCVGEITVKTMAPLNDDIGNLQSALNTNGYAQGFMNSATPGVIALFQPNEYYKTQDDYLEAVAEGMRAEYEGIVASGLILQLDSPDLGLGRHMMYKELTDEGFVTRAERHIEVLNHALRNIPGDRVRMHVCWGNYEGPHNCDIALKKVLPSILKAKPRALLFEAMNPRHAHEWIDWKSVDLPDDYVLIPGMLDSTTNFVEHPELIAERLMNFVNIVGADRVIAGTDCGFSTFAGFGAVDPDIVWLKLKSLREGTDLVNDRMKLN